MPEHTVDLSKLRQEINSRKTQVQTKEVALGKVPAGAIAKSGNKKQFLNELLTSMHQGVKTNASEAIRVVNETVEAKKGAPPAVAKSSKYVPPRPNASYIPENVQPRPQTNDWGIPQGVAVGGGYEGEREGLFEQNLQKQMHAFDQMKMSGNPIAAQIMQQAPFAHMQQPQQYLNEQQRVAPQMVTENIDQLVESAFKNVLTEIYTKQKIQEALSEFLKSDDFVKVVSQAIVEISKRNKAKQGK